MKQVFHAGIAKRHGMAAAVLAEHIWREVKENEFQGRHRYGGNVWMRCSVPMFTALMPYLSKGMVQGGLRRLAKGGLIVKGEFNQSRFDRTSWYAFTAYGKKIMEECEDRDYE